MLNDFLQLVRTCDISESSLWRGYHSVERDKSHGCSWESLRRLHIQFEDHSCKLFSFVDLER